MDENEDEIVGGWSLVHCSIERAGRGFQPLDEWLSEVVLSTRDGWMGALADGKHIEAWRPSC